MEYTPIGTTGRLLSTLGLPTALVTKLKQAGYETTSDLAGASEAELVQELAMNQTLPQPLRAYLSNRTFPGGFAIPRDPPLRPVSASQALSQSLALSNRPLNVTRNWSDSASASALLTKPRTYPTPSPKINSLLFSGTPTLNSGKINLTPPPEAGLRSSHVLEICGPPGSGKASLALEFIRSAVDQKETVLVADCQGALPPGRIYDALDQIVSQDEEDHPSKLILQTHLPSLVHLLAFIRTLPKYLQEHKDIKLMVISTLSFVFQSTEYFSLSASDKTRILGTVKQALTRACLENNITIVITNQTATKLVGLDGSVANFNTGAKAFLASQLGSPLFTASRSYRLMLSRDALGVRHSQLIASPAMASSLNTKLGSAKSPFRTSPEGDAKRVAFVIDEEGRVRDV